MKPASSNIPKKRPLLMLDKKNSRSIVLKTTVAEPLIKKLPTKQHKHMTKNEIFQLDLHFA